MLILLGLELAHEQRVMKVSLHWLQWVKCGAKEFTKELKLCVLQWFEEMDISSSVIKHWVVRVWMQCKERRMHQLLCFQHNLFAILLAIGYLAFSPCHNFMVPSFHWPMHRILHAQWFWTKARSHHVSLHILNALLSRLLLEDEDKINQLLLLSSQKTPFLADVATSLNAVRWELLMTKGLRD